MSTRLVQYCWFSVSLAAARTSPRMNGSIQSTHNKMAGVCLKRWKGSSILPRTLSSWFGWFGIPASLGVCCLAFVQLRRILKREPTSPASSQPVSWQVRVGACSVQRRGSHICYSVVVAVNCCAPKGTVHRGNSDAYLPRPVQK